MKWLTIDYIKQHSRIDYDCEDDLLELYGNDAEDTVLRLIRRTLENVKDMNDGEVPPQLFHAALMLVDVSYEHRNPNCQAQLHQVELSFNFIIADFIRYTRESDIEAEKEYLLKMLRDVNSDLVFDYSMLADPTEEQTASFNTESEKIVEVASRYTNIENPTPKICAALRQKVSDIKEECKNIFNSEE